ncbi:hypothetical protein GCM10012289_18290 [Nonomuraea cavernae]|uniref:Uncharacterized protein n=1 Tax=Nonomuraea cavernae TaxID=2045107 RepID=A0A917YTH6_9ACTN|nr:hypothetical protein GCM10012289_18290 [Nonomuraea cavernae]
MRTELWAARLAAGLEPDAAALFARELVNDGTPEARLTLAALSVVDMAPLADPDDVDTGDVFADPDILPDRLRALGQPDMLSEASEGRDGPDHSEAPDEALGERDDVGEALGKSEDVGEALGKSEDVGEALGEIDDVGDRGEASAYTTMGRAAMRTLPAWVARMGRVTCDGAWYGCADRYGQQTLAALRFRYDNGKEPHLLVVGIDQVNGGLAVDALVEEVKFLDDLDLQPADPAVVAGRVLDAFELTGRVMGAMVADTLPAVRPLALARARVVPHPIRQAPDETVTAFQDLPDLPGAREAFEKLVEFVGDRPRWWSPGRVSTFFTSWLPREAVLSDEAIAAMPAVARAWTRFHGDHPEVLAQVDADAPRLPALMADDSLAGLAKRIALTQRPSAPDR